MTITEILISDEMNQNMTVITPSNTTSRARDETIIVYDKEDIKGYFAVAGFGFLGLIFLGISILLCIKSWKYSGEITSIKARIDMLKTPAPETLPEA